MSLYELIFSICFRKLRVHANDSTCYTFNKGTLNKMDVSCCISARERIHLQDVAGALRCDDHDKIQPSKHQHVRHNNGNKQIEKHTYHVRKERIKDRNPT